MANCLDKNMIDKDEYPQTAELERRYRVEERVLGPVRVHRERQSRVLFRAR